MFERYLERARRALFFARYEASQLGSISIEPPHLLLGIFREGTTVTAALLAQSRLSADALRSELAALVAAPAKSTSVEIPFAPDTKRALTNAAAEADRAHSGGIDADHLLLGVLVLGGSASAHLAKHGITVDSVRALVAQEKYEPAPSPQSGLAQQPLRDDTAPVAEDVVFEVRIAPTRIPSGQHGANRSSNHQWTLEGLELESALSQICGDKHRPIETAADFPLPFPMSRIELDPSFDHNARYDFHVSGRNLDRNFQKELLRLGIEQYFGASIVREARLMDVYVLTATDGRLEKTTASNSGGGVGSISMTGSEPPVEDFAGLPPAEILRRLARRTGGKIGSISASGTSLHILCHTLEMPLGRPVVNETELTGTYSFHLTESGESDSFPDRLERQLGLKLTEAQREIPFIVMRKN